MAREMKTAVDFYDRHPISAAIILARLEAARGSLDGLTPPDLFPHDQDHYGGLAVNDALVARAELAAGQHVVDFCAGLGGPARYFAHTYGVEVTGIELTPARVAGAQELTRLVGLADRVRVLEGDVTHVPLADATADVVVSQEAFLHVPDKAAVLGEAFRILKPGGRLAFTDWVAHRPFSEADRALMWEGMAVTSQHDQAAYVALIEGAGFRMIAVDDLTAAWGEILRQRLVMFTEMREEAARAGTPAGHDAFYQSYVRFVALVTDAALGGGRFTAIKP